MHGLWGSENRVRVESADTGGSPVLPSPSVAGAGCRLRRLMHRPGDTVSFHGAAAHRRRKATQFLLQLSLARQLGPIIAFYPLLGTLKSNDPRAS